MSGPAAWAWCTARIVPMARTPTTSRSSSCTPHLATDATRQAFRRERQLLADLEHPAIPRLLDGGTDENGIPYLVMEYVDGTRLADLSEPLPVARLVALTIEVCRAVHAAHCQRVIHGDLHAREHHPRAG